jgi:hypothetical protein
MASVDQPAVEHRLLRPILSHRFLNLHLPNLAACQRGIRAVPDQRLTPRNSTRPTDRVTQAQLAPAALLPFGIF